MRRLALVATAAALVAATTHAVQASPARAAWTGLRAGVAVVDATWHVGAGAGQYASDENPADASSEWDPNVEHVKQASSYGVASRLSIRAIVVQDGQGDPPVALVKVDNYLSQDMLSRRVGQLLAAAGSKVTYDHVLVSATHDHNSPYYSTPAAGVWLFQDVMDLRMFEYQARQMAAAIEQAERHMVPARVGAATVQFGGFQGNIAGSDVNEDGSPTGYPLWDNDHGVTVLRFDNMSNPKHPRPLATYVNYAEHGESLDGYDLISGDWVAPFQRYVDRATGVPTVFSQGSVGSAEGPYEYANPKTLRDRGQPFYWIYGHMGYAQAERGTHLLAEHVVGAWRRIRGASNVKVAMLTQFVGGPLSHPYPSVGNCRTGPSVAGDPGVPGAGLPDCARSGDNVGLTLPLSPTLFDQLKAAGAPIPDNYDVTSFQTVEENVRIKLQAVRIGSILLASCSCEAQADLIRNLESRTDARTGDMYYGFDYTNPAMVAEGWPGMHVRPCVKVGAAYSCPDPRDRWGKARLKVAAGAVAHMKAEVDNNAAGWDDPSYVLQAGSEPTKLSAIKGNFTHTELGAGAYKSCRGYSTTVGLGHTGDYDGYTVSYREYESRDAYRKALTSYGPHTADYMVTDLLAMAATLKCGAPLTLLPGAPVTAVDEARQAAEASVLGSLSSVYYDGWTAQLPDSAGPARALQQPWSVQRFDVTQFRWVGGDNWTDDPTVVVQRFVRGQWRFYADQSGEVQTFLDNPGNFLTDASAYRTGGQSWHWRASFEAFDAYPRADVAGGQVPNGRYRFVVDGHIKLGGKVRPYHLASKPFAVRPWLGLRVTALGIHGQFAVVRVAPVVYPRLPVAAHYAGIAWYADDKGGTPGHSLICKTCHFRPWASTGRVTSVVVDVQLPNGRTEAMHARYSPRLHGWAVRLPSTSDVSIGVDSGSVRDSYGERNAIGVGFASATAVTPGRLVG